MKHTLTSLALALCTASAAQAQTFTDHIQQRQEGLGTVTVRQSDEVEQLVNKGNTTGNNGTPTPKGTPQTPKTTPTNTKKTATGGKTTNTTTTAAPQDDKNTKGGKATTPDGKLKEQTTGERVTPATTRPDSTRKHREGANATPNEKPREAEGELNIPTIDMRRKVMRGRKVNGYRVQAFAGGNSRQDKIKAQKAGNDIKMKFPELPIYVHFYSPRWICRVGNFRTYEEARQVLLEIKAMGYKAATIVQGKITVMY